MKTITHQQPDRAHMRSSTPRRFCSFLSVVRRTILSIGLVLGFAAGSQSAFAQVNGTVSFGSSPLTWKYYSNNGKAQWYSYTGAMRPVSSITNPSINNISTMAPVPAGHSAAISAASDPGFPGASILYRDFTLAAGATHTLKFTVGYRNWLGLQGDGNTNIWFRRGGTYDNDFNIIEGTSLLPLTSTASGFNQQFRVDLVEPTVDPMNGNIGSIAPGDVIMKIYETVKSGDANPNPASFGRSAASQTWETFTVNLSSLSATATRTVRLRFAVAQTEFFLDAFVDNVELVSSGGSISTEKAQLALVRGDLGTILVPVTNSDDRKKLTEAITKLLEADTATYWDAEGRPTRDDGNKIFDKTKDAVGKLVTLNKDAKTLALRGTLAGAGKPIDNLVATARTMATSQINLLASVGPGSEKPEDAAKKLGDAREELAKGDADAMKPDATGAVDHYKHAWEKAKDELYDISKEN